MNFKAQPIIFIKSTQIICEYKKFFLLSIIKMVVVDADSDIDNFDDLVVVYLQQKLLLRKIKENTPKLATIY